MSTGLSKIIVGLALLAWAVMLPASAAPLSQSSFEASLRVGSKDPMVFGRVLAQKIPCPQLGLCKDAIVASGTILGDSPERLLLYLTSHKANPPRLAILESRGGVYLAGLRLGMIFRENGISTWVPPSAACQSACAYAFLGGSQRFLGLGAHYGLHVGRADAAGAINGRPPPSTALAYSPMELDTAVDKAYANADADFALLLKYVSAMGVRNEFLPAVFHSFAEPYDLTPMCAAYLGVTTNVKPPPTNPCATPQDIPAVMCGGSPGMGSQAADKLLSPGRGFASRCKNVH